MEGLKQPKGENQPEYVRNEALAKQFEESEKYTYGSTTIEAFDVQPEKLKTEVPVFFGTGWSASRGVYEASMLGIADRGRRLLSVFAPHGIDTDSDFGKGDKTYAAAELRKAAAMLHTLEEKGVEQLDIVAHSESALWTLIVATMHPEKIRNIVLIDPAGLIDDETTPRLATSFCLDIVQGALNKEKLPRPEIERSVQPGSPADLFGALKNMAGDPMRSLKEVLAMRDADIRFILEDLKAQGKHISIIQGARDAIFPMERMQRVVNTSQVDGFYSVYGAHNEINSNPEAYIHVIDVALDALEKLSEKDKDSVK
ncbi:MAG: alpha/beta hydrolase [Candidatus Parcubacteria bacterium]|nr:alpha/beta hydrolase [Candidatus Parcubacteria bacterium]